VILVSARELLAAAAPLVQRRGLTLIGIAVGNLDDGHAVQLALPFARHHGTALDAALDEVRTRFGSGSVTRARLLGRDPGLTVPLLPD
jgi:DNA polymerase-4